MHVTLSPLTLPMTLTLHQTLSVTPFFIMLLNSLSFAIFILIPLSSVRVFATRYLNLTTTAAVNNKSTLQCWQLSTPFTTSTQPGTVGSMAIQLGGLANATYSIIPAGTNSGAHNTPAVQ